MHTNSTFLARISPLWLTKLRRLWPSVSWQVVCELVVPDRFSLYAWTAQSAHSDFVGSRVYVCLGVTRHLHFWQNDWGLLRATVVTWGRKDTEWESAQKVRLTEDNLAKNCGSGNEEHEPQLGHHPEAGQWQTWVEELRCCPICQLA